jgi:BirA family biotin operon repressor/biotin-[acetyl-CoA-carboxylase] ligase
MDNRSLHIALNGLPLSKIAYYESIGSTNDVAADWARRGLEGLALAVADEQTRGRGRSGRRWFTPPGSALAFSLLLQSRIPASRATGRITGLGALAVCEALEELFSLSPQIKWPNDVLVEGKKICGVLAETHWSGDRLAAMILGIGINIAASSVPPPPALNFPAACLEKFTNTTVNRMELLRKVLESILDWKENIGQSDFIAAWESRLAYRGQVVTVEVNPGEHSEAELLGLAEDGQLKLLLPSGATRVYAAGEIRLPAHTDDRQA